MIEDACCPGVLVFGGDGTVTGGPEPVEDKTYRRRDAGRRAEGGTRRPGQCFKYSENPGKRVEESIARMLNKPLAAFRRNGGRFDALMTKQA